MDREKQLQDIARFHANKFSTRNGYTTVEEACLATADWADAHPKNPWINVKDELPSVGEYVLALTEGGNVSVMRYNSDQEFERSFWLSYTMKDGGKTTIDYKQTFKTTITHWMPVPARPYLFN